MILVAVLGLLALALAATALGRMRSPGHRDSAAEGSVSQAQEQTRPEDSAAESDASASAGGQEAEKSAEDASPVEEEQGESTLASGSIGPVSGGVPASPQAAEDDPYPGLYAQWEEKTDDNTQKIVYLTFDDGPSENTDRILEILDQCDVKAAFFVSAQFGTQEERAQRLRSILEHGHTLGLHTYSHDYEKIYASVDSFLSDLNRINEEVYAATGYQATLIRFPGGSENRYNGDIREELTAEIRRRGYTYHDWAVSCGDAEGLDLSADEVMRETADECEKRDKSVVLFHDTPTQDTTVEALVDLIDELREQGYEFRALDNTIRPFQFIKAE